MEIRPVDICLFLLLTASACSDQVNPVTLNTISGRTMGTEYEIKLPTAGALSAELLTQTQNDIDSLLASVNQCMSTYIDSSEISRFNSVGTTDWVSVSSETAAIVRLALSVSEKSNGAFDITAGPLVNLWGFGPEESTGDVPDAARVDQTMSYVGFRNLSSRPFPPSVRKDIPEIYCDLAAIAKGYGVDRAAEYLDDRGISDYLIEIGGEIRAKGRNSQNALWQIGIATPDAEPGIETVVALDDASMATSGDYRRYFEREGVRYSHVIDPRTGRPITHRLASVTVIDDECAYADAMATAIIVLGPEEGYDLALRENLAALLILREKDSFVDRMTPAFESYLIRDGRENGN